MKVLGELKLSVANVDSYHVAWFGYVLGLRND